MALPLLMAIGAGVQMLAQYGANIQQSIYEKENAEAYKQQVDLAKAGMERELDIAGAQYANQFGNVVSGFAAQGIDIGSGSASVQVASIAIARMQELDAIRKQGEFQIKLASSRQRRSEEEARTLGSIGYNLTQAGTTALTAYTQYKQLGV